MQLLVFVSMAFAIGSVMFALQNNVPVAVTLFVWRFDSSLAMVILLALAIGGLVVALVSTPGTVRRQWTIKRQAKRIAELEGQLRTLDAELAAWRSGTSVTPAINLEHESERPYVGLKRLLSGSVTPGSDTGD